MTRTIRARTTAVAAVLTGALLTVMSAAVVSLLRTQLTENLDDALRHRADTISELLGSGVTTFPVDEDTVLRLTFGGRDPTITGDLSAVPDWAGATTVPLSTVTAVGTAGVRLRVLTETVGRPGQESVELQLAIRLDDVTGPTRIAGRALAVAVPAAVLVIAALVWWLVGLALRPVESMRAELVDITASDLARRLTEPGTGDEIDRLARTANATLDRLEAAVDRQRRLVADVSHELRSPLARMRAALEVDLAVASSATDPVRCSVLDDTIGLQHLVDDLLHLARSDAGEATTTGSAVVDLDDLLLGEVVALGPRPEVHVDTSRVGAVQVRGDRQELARALRNLLANAVRHARSSVTVELDEVPAAGGARLARLTVTDDGAGIAPEHRQRVFDRFARLDDARSTGDGGTGLGLAITLDVVIRHGGTITIEGDPGTVFVVQLPLAP